MPEPSLIQRERSLLRTLTLLVEHRARTESELVERLRAGGDAIERQFSDALQRIQTASDTERASIQADLEQQLAAVRATHEAQLGEARRAMDAQVAAFNERTNRTAGAARKQLAESLWLVETVVESGESKIRQDYEIAKKILGSRAASVDGLENAANALLASRRHPPLQVPPPPGDAPAPPARPKPQLFAALDQSSQNASAAYRALVRRVRPTPLLIGPIFLIATGTAALAATLARFAFDRTDLRTLAIAAGATLAGTLIVLFALRLLLRRRVPAAAAALAGDIAEARALIGQCVQVSRGERNTHTAGLQARRDADTRAARAAFETDRDTVNRRNNILLPRLRDRHAQRMGRIRERLAGAVAAIEADRAAQLESSDRRRETALAEATARRDAKRRQLQADDAAGWDELVAAWRDGRMRIDAEREALAALGDSQWPDWFDPAWADFGSRIAHPVVPAARFGRLEIDMAALPGGLPSDPRLRVTGPGGDDLPTRFALPALIDLLDRGSMLIHAGDGGRDAGLALLKDVMLRLLTSLPPGKVRFTIIDPVGLGQSFAGFMHLADFEESLVSDRIWTEPRHIEQKLADLTEHMETVIQKYLRNEYENIQQYNDAAGEVAEPYRFLVIADFPASITDTAAKRLASIVASGPRCGVYTLIAAEPRRAGRSGPFADLLSAIERESITLAWQTVGQPSHLPAGGTPAPQFVYKDEDFARWPLESEWPPAEDELTRLLTEVGHSAKDATRVQVPFETVAPESGDLWSLDAAEEIRVPLGRAGAKKLQYLTLGRGTTQHALIAGRTGSGKSTLLHVLVTNLAMWYSPDEVEFYLVDFKKGVEFKTYATHSLPHARVIAVESEREFGLSVLRKLDAELTRRGELFRTAGVQDMAGFRRHVMEDDGDGEGGGVGGGGAGIPPARTAGTAAALHPGTSLPRILLIVDEFQEFFVEDDKIAQEASLLLDRLVRQGRAFGMHVVLGSQTLGGAYSIARSTIGQMAVRIALQCSEADSYLIMSEDNSAPRLLARPGEAIYNDASGMIEGNSPFQIVWLPEPTRDRALQQVRDRLAGLPPPPAPIVFEGNIPADLRKCAPLARSLGGAGVPPATLPTIPTAWLGEAISIKDPTSISFPRHSGANLLIVGHQEEAALATLAAAALGLAATVGRAPRGASDAGPSLPTLHLLDASTPDASQATPLPSLFSRLFARTAAPRQAPPLLAALAAELDRRLADDDAAGVVGGAREVGQASRLPSAELAPPLFLFIAGLHRFRDLRRPDDFGFSSDDTPTPPPPLPPPPAEGPAVGIHTLAWCDTVTNVDRMLDRAALREFEARILFQMSQNDSTQLIDTPAAATLGRHRALLARADQGILEKFRPYAPPDPAWLDRTLAAITGGPASPA